MNIIDVLGENYKTIKLYDDNSVSYGGLSREEETLEEFMNSADIYENDSIGELQRALKLSGLKEIEIADSKIQELIQQKIWDIEEELEVDIIDYQWDYKYK